MAMSALIIGSGLMNSFLSMQRQDRELKAQHEFGQRMIGIGGNIERSELSMQMEAERLASTEESIMNTERLRSVLASQNVLAATRGQKTGAGSTRAAASTAERAFARDERAREIALNFRTYNLQSQQRISHINQAASEFGLSSQVKGARNALSDNFTAELYNKLGSQLSSFTSSGTATRAPVERREATPSTNKNSYGRRRA